MEKYIVDEMKRLEEQLAVFAKEEEDFYQMYQTIQDKPMTGLLSKRYQWDVQSDVCTIWRCMRV